MTQQTQINQYDEFQTTAIQKITQADGFWSDSIYPEFITFQGRNVQVEAIETDGWCFIVDISTPYEHGESEFWASLQGEVSRNPSLSRRRHRADETASHTAKREPPRW